MSVPLSEAAIADNAKDMAHEEHVLTLEELNAIIDKLPDGYGKVFRLAVLDGFSHKEIGALLGIAPHSSSSQLTRAKAMLRRMIVQYRVGGYPVADWCHFAPLLWDIQAPGGKYFDSYDK